MDVSAEPNKRSQNHAKQMQKDIEKLKDHDIHLVNEDGASRYLCRICNYHCDSIQRAIEHSKKERHNANLKSHHESVKLYYVPPANELHMLALDAFLSNIVLEKSLSVDEVARRKSVAEKIISAIHSSCPDLQANLFGSLFTGLAIHESDVNISVSHKKENADVQPGSVLSEVANVLKKITAPSFETLAVNSLEYCITDLVHNHKGVPCVMAMDKEMVLYKITCGNHSEMEADALIKTYCQINTRCQELAILLRSFARVADIDQPQKGCMIPRVLPVLVIFYLQNKPKQPILPNLHRIAETNLSHLPVEAIHQVSSGNGNHGRSQYLCDLSHLERFFDLARSIETLAELWLGLLRFYLFDFNKEVYLVSITAFHPVIKYNRSKQLGVQDPIDVRRNLCGTITPLETHVFIREQLEGAFRYFSIPQVKSKKNEWGCEPLYSHWRLIPVEELTKGGGGDEKGVQVALTTANTSQRSYTAPLKRIEESINDFLQCGSSGENMVTGLKLSEFLPQLNKWALGNVCLLPPSAGQTYAELCEISNWSIDFSALQLQTDQVARLQRYAAAFCRHVWDTIWQEYFSREEYAMKSRDLSAILQSAARYALSEEILSGVNANKEIPPPSKKVSLCVSEGGESRTSIDFLPDRELVLEDNEPDLEDNYSDADLLEEDGGELLIRERERVVSETLQQCCKKDAPLVPYGRSGWAVALNRPKTDMKIGECNKPGYYNSKLVLERVKKVKHLHFVWDKCMLTHQAAFVPMCAFCQMNGHLRDECTKHLPTLEDPKIFDEKILKHAGMVLVPMLVQVQRAVEPTEAVKKEREKTVNRLQSIIQKAFPEALLRTFGSSVNGFGNLRSDLDLNVRLSTEMEPGTVTSTVVRLEQLLLKSQQFTDVQAIKQAKVPVVKFKDVSNNIVGDISLSNLLALENSRLLRLYSDLNEHCHILGLALKYLMKACGICDASCGSLSSYTYIIMLVHYLQQRRCLPILQKIYEEDKKPVNMIDGYDCWFQQDQNVIKKYWQLPNPPPNLGELWLGFFKYYIYEFDAKNQVVSIRGPEKLLKSNKLWTDCCFAVEDPFDLSHNLGKILTSRMLGFILTVFYNVLKSHSSAPPSLTTFSEIVDRYFNPNQLLKGLTVPTDKGCKRCGKLGHYIDKCPLIRENQSWGQPSISCIPLKQSDNTGTTKSGPNQLVSLLCVNPRIQEPNFMATQPFGQFGWPPKEGFSVEPLLLPLGNNESILLPVLTHPNEKIMRDIAQRQTKVARVLTVDALRNMHFNAFPLTSQLIVRPSVIQDHLIGVQHANIQPRMEPSFLRPNAAQRPLGPPMTFQPHMPSMAPTNQYYHNNFPQIQPMFRGPVPPNIQFVRR